MLRGLVAGCWTLALAFLTLGGNGKAISMHACQPINPSSILKLAFRIDFVRRRRLALSHAIS